MTLERFSESPIFKGLEDKIEGTKYPVRTLQEWVNQTADIDDRELNQELLDDVVTGASRYLEIVLTSEHLAIIQEKRLSPEQYRDSYQAIDNNRRITHNAFCDSVRVFTRALSQTNPGEYLKEWWDSFGGGSEGDRVAIGKWGLQIAFDKLQEELEKEVKKHD